MLAYSTLGLPDWPAGDQAELVRRFGFDGIEIALTPAQVARSADAAYWDETRAAVARAGAVVTALHLGDPRLQPDPAAPRMLHPDPAERRRHLQAILAAFEIAERLGASRVCCATGSPVPIPEADAWRLAMEILTAALREIPPGVALLAEHEPEHFLDTSARVLRLWELSEGRVGCVLDVGHVQVCGEPIGETIERLGRAVIGDVHLEDIAERVHRHLLPGDGEIDFAEVDRALRAIGYEGPLVADLYPFAGAPVPALIRARRAFGFMVEGKRSES